MYFDCELCVSKKKNKYKYTLAALSTYNGNNVFSYWAFFRIEIFFFFLSLELSVSFQYGMSEENKRVFGIWKRFNYNENICIKNPFS